MEQVERQWFAKSGVAPDCLGGVINDVMEA